jgi:hypothetical protein
MMYSSMHKRLNVFKVADEVTTVSTSLLYDYKNISSQRVQETSIYI